MKRFLVLFNILMSILAVVFLLKILFLFMPDLNPLTDNQKGFGWLIRSSDKISGKASDQPGEKAENKGEISRDDETVKPAIPDESNTGGSTQKASEDYFITFNEIQSIEGISLRDKIKGISLISKINRADLESIYKLAEGGITYEELRELKGVLDRNLSREEIDQLDELLMKNKRLYAEGKLND